MKSPHTLVIIDEDPLAVQGLRDLLASMPEFEIVGFTTQLETGIELIEAFGPDAVLLGFQELYPASIERLHTIRRSTNRPVIVLACEERIQYVRRLLTAGAHGFIHKGMDVNDLINSLTQSIVEGRPVVAVPNPVDWLVKLARDRRREPATDPSPEIRPST